MDKIIFIVLFTFVVSCKGDAKVKNKSKKKIEGSVSKASNEGVRGLESNHQSSDSLKIEANYTDYLVGKITYSSEPDFIKVDPKYSSKEIYLRKETYQAFLEMQKVASEDGVSLIVISGARNFNHQSAIWNKKWKASKIEAPKERALDILKYSAMPMCSRHHWGTDFDLNNLESSYFESGEGKKIYDWLLKNASKFGFCQVYTDKMITKRSGYEKEEWHWSYMPLASQLLNSYNQRITEKEITGFEGSETAQSIGIIKNFVNGVTICDYKK